MSKVKFKDLNDSILNKNICHSVCLNNSLIYDSNKYDISFDKFIEIQQNSKNKDKTFYFIEISKL